MKSFFLNLWEDIKSFFSHFRVYLKWLALALVVGAVLGAVGAGFYYALFYAGVYREAHPWFIWLLPVAGLVIAAMYYFFEKNPLTEENKGTNMVLAAVNGGEDIPFRMLPLIFLSSAISHLFGASVGREGAALQMGASFGSTVSRLLKFNENDSKVLIMTGMSAAFAAIFGSPLTAAVFSMEVISVGVMYYAALVPCMVSALTALYVARLLGVQYAVYALGTVPALAPLSAGKVMVLGILCAVLSIIICYTLIITERGMQNVFDNPFVKIFVAGTVVALLTLLVGSQDYNGLGTAVILKAAAGQAVWYAFLLKLLFTAVSLAGGYRGGEIVPSLFMGATFGCFAAGFLGLSPSLGAALGMIAVFCGVTNSPIASFIMGLELFGGQGMWMFGLVVAVSYMLSGYYGLYKSQLIIYSKYRSVYVHRKAHR
ncbi:MAG: chloride channel protein [Clostridia bacterium]|nr:chloride channel protein [Clostridia bacterium]MBR1704039.1 chloride channel protein [Clostridia bacterium]